MKKRYAACLGLIACILSVGLYVRWKFKKQMAAVMVIGGADGPTSIFLAGKLGRMHQIGTFLIVAALLLLVIFLCYIVKRRRRFQSKSPCAGKEKE